VTTRLADEQANYPLAMRLSYSGKAVHRIIAPCGTRRSVHALSVLGVPTGKVRL
jgi:hypothetical protein